MGSCTMGGVWCTFKVTLLVLHLYATLSVVFSTFMGESVGC